jgi:hypothetical protein
VNEQSLGKYNDPADQLNCKLYDWPALKALASGLVSVADFFLDSS